MIRFTKALVCTCWECLITRVGWLIAEGGVILLALHKLADALHICPF